MATEFTYRIRTPRLELIRATLRVALAEAENAGNLRALLNVKMPRQWPPPLNDAESLQWAINMLREPEQAPWSFYYIVVVEGRSRKLAGLMGFKGKPSRDGTVEVGYSIVPEQQRRGYASEGVRALIEVAFDSPAVRRVVAETFPELTPSIGVMLKCAMRYLGPGSEAGTVRYGITREEWTKRG